MINFSDFTRDNGAVQTLREVLFTTTYQTSELGTTLDIRTGVQPGKHLAYIDNIGDVAKAGRGCNPTYDKVMPKGFEKVWELGDWSTPIEFCADDWKETIARYALKTGTEAEDMSGTEIMDNILIPLLDRAHVDAMWRMVWFGDKNAKNISEGGVITETVKTNLFTMADGLWKRINTIIASNTAQKTEIAANDEPTAAKQISELNKEGVAVGIVESLLASADSRIRNNGGKLMMTNSFYQALRKDYNRVYRQTIPFNNVSQGISISEFDGIDILVLDPWDQNIKKFENDGTKLNNPHRVLFANPDNLLAGTEDKQLLANVELSFDQRTRTNLFYSASNIGTLVAEDELIQVAI